MKPLLEKDRTRRYETATGVAADIQRHLDNEPVLARPPSQLYRFQRILRRNQIAVKWTLFAFFFVVFVTVGDGIRKYRHSEHERRVLEIAEQQQKDNFDQARAAVGDLLAICREDLQDLPGMQSLRVKLMQKVIDRYKPFLQQSSDDPAPRAELARLYVNYAFTAREIGADESRLVLPYCEAAYAIQQKLVLEHPKNRSWRLDLGWTVIYCNWWTTDQFTNKWAPTNAMAIFEALVKENPADPFARNGLVWALEMGSANATNLFGADGRKSLAIAEQLVKEFPRSAEFRRDLANQLLDFAFDNEGHALTNRDGSFNHAAYLTNLLRANDLRAAVAADLEKQDPAIWSPELPRDSEARLVRPSMIWMKRDLALTWFWAAKQEEALQQWPQAIAFSDRAVAIYRELVESNPSMVQFARELQRASLGAVQLAQSSGDAAGARTRQLAADDFWQKHPDAKPKTKSLRMPP